MCFHEGHKLKHVALTTFNMKTHYPPSAPPTWYKQEVQTASFVSEATNRMNNMRWRRSSITASSYKLVKKHGGHSSQKTDLSVVEQSFHPDLVPKMAP